MPKPKKSLFENVDAHFEVLLQGITAGKSRLTLKKSSRIFSQGDQTDALYFIESGKVKISVVSTRGREAVLAILGGRDFFGEGSSGRATASNKHRDGTGIVRIISR